MKSFLLLTLTFLLLVATAAAQKSIVVNTGGTVNCVTTIGENGFEADSFALSGSNGTSIGGTEGTGAGRVMLSALTIQKQFNICSEQLIQNFLNGTHIPTVTLTEYSVSRGKPQPSMVITLTGAVINAYSISGSVSATPAENVGFAYQSVCIANYPQSPDGSIGRPVTVCYDASRNIVTTK